MTPAERADLWLGFLVAAPLGVAVVLGAAWWTEALDLVCPAMASGVPGGIFFGVVGALWGTR